MIGVYCAKIAYCNVYQNDVQSWQLGELRETMATSNVETVQLTKRAKS